MGSLAPSSWRLMCVASGSAGLLLLASASVSSGQSVPLSVYKRPQTAVAVRARDVDQTQTKRILAALPERIESVMVTGPLGVRRKTLGMGQPKLVPPKQNPTTRVGDQPVYPPAPPVAPALAEPVLPPPPTLEETLLNFNSFLFAFIPKLYEQIDPATVEATVFAAGQFKSQGIPGGTIFDGAQIMLLRQDLPAGVQSIIATGRLKLGTLPVLATEANEEWRHGKLIVYLAAPDRRTLIAASSKEFLDELLVNLGNNAPKTPRFPTLTQLPEAPVNVWGIRRVRSTAARDRIAVEDGARPTIRFVSFSLNQVAPELVIRTAFTKPVSEMLQKEISSSNDFGKKATVRWLDGENCEQAIPNPEFLMVLIVLATMGHTIYV